MALQRSLFFLDIFYLKRAVPTFDQFGDVRSLTSIQIFQNGMEKTEFGIKFLSLAR